MAEPQRNRTLHVVVPFRDPDGTPFVSVVLDQPSIGIRFTIDAKSLTLLVKRLEQALVTFKQKDEPKEEA